MLVSVVIPTYRRPQDLLRCLGALKQQTRSADEVLVVVRDLDQETWEYLGRFDCQKLPLRAIAVTIPGQVAALNVGLDNAKGDIIAITDDDAAPHVDWLERIENHFLVDPNLGGVGGRDWLYLNGKLQDASMHPGASQVIGKLYWYGRAVGNHHIGEGKPREVDILKGANMSYRKAATHGLRFDERLQGLGAQAHNDLAFSLSVKCNGWKLIYDPSVAVDHHLAQRFDEDQRMQFNNTAFCNAAHNETLILLGYLSSKSKLLFFIWAVLVGTRGAPGFIQFLRFLPTERRLASQKWFAAMQGRWRGWQTFRDSFQNLSKC